jgi:hypothetical protein
MLVVGVKLVLKELDTVLKYHLFFKLSSNIFQARPVWICTQSNIANILFTWVHNTNTEKKINIFIENWLLYQNKKTLDYHAKRQCFYEQLFIVSCRRR